MAVAQVAKEVHEDRYLQSELAKFAAGVNKDTLEAIEKSEKRLLEGIKSISMFSLLTLRIIVAMVSIDIFQLATVTWLGHRPVLLFTTKES